jgi:hypothetical protein
MKPSNTDKRTGKLSIEQYLGLVSGMNLTVAGRMLTLAGDYTNDVIALHEEAADPRLDRAALMALARAATRAETRLARLLVIAAENCEGELVVVPYAIRSNIKTTSRCRSAICKRALAAEQQGDSSRLAA